MELANGQLTLSITIALSLARLLLTSMYSQILIVTSNGIVHFHNSDMPYRVFGKRKNQLWRFTNLFNWTSQLQTTILIRNNWFNLYCLGLKISFAIYYYAIIRRIFTYLSYLIVEYLISNVRLMLKLWWRIRILVMIGVMNIMLLKYKLFVRQNICYNVHLPRSIRRTKSNLLSPCMKVESNTVCSIIIWKCVCLCMCV